MSDRQDMIPRIIIRDEDDALLILLALRTHHHLRMEELLKDSRKPHADVYALSLQQIEETKNVTSLMTEIANDLPDIEPDDSDLDTGD